MRTHKPWMELDPSVKLLSASMSLATAQEPAPTLSWPKRSGPVPTQFQASNSPTSKLPRSPVSSQGPACLPHPASLFITYAE